MKVSKLVTDALFLSLLDRQSDTGPTDEQAQEGLQCLQNVLAEQALSIPYRQLEIVTDIKALSNTGFETIDAVSYLLGGQRYPLEIVGLSEWNRRRTTRVQSIPEIYFFNPANKSIQVYPLPSSGGSFEVWGRKVDTPMRIEDELDPSLPSVFVQYLTYLTAYELSVRYDIPWTPEKQRRLESWASALTNQTVIDTEADPQYAYSDGSMCNKNNLLNGSGWRL